MLMNVRDKSFIDFLVSDFSCCLAEFQTLGRFIERGIFLKGNFFRELKLCSVVGGQFHSITNIAAICLD